MFHRHRWIVVGNEPWLVENVRTHGSREVIVTGLRCDCGKREVVKTYDISMDMAKELYPLGEQVKR